MLEALATFNRRELKEAMAIDNLNLLQLMFDSLGEKYSFEVRKAALLSLHCLLIKVCTRADACEYLNKARPYFEQNKLTIISLALPSLIN